MAENVFLENKRKLSLTEYMNYNTNDRGNLGDQLPVAVYRLMEYSIREQLAEQLGEEEQVRIFRKAGFKAGAYFAENILDISLPLNAFIASLQSKMEEMKIGVLRIENSMKKQEGSCLPYRRTRTAPAFRCWGKRYVIMMKALSPVFYPLIREKSILPWRLIAGRQGIVCAGSVWNRKRRGRRWKRIIVSCCLNT